MPVTDTSLIRGRHLERIFIEPILYGQGKYRKIIIVASDAPALLDGPWLRGSRLIISNMITVALREDPHAESRQ